MSETVLFQTIQFSIQKQFYFGQFSTQFSSILDLDRTLSSGTISSQRRPGSDVTEGVLRIPQKSRITGASPSDCLASSRTLVFGEGSYPYAEKQLVYSAAPT